MEPASVKAEEFKAAMASFAAGVTVVTTMDERNFPQALTATAFSSVSVSPPQCLVCIDKRARTYQPLLLKGCFAVNILSSDQESLSARFAAPLSDRFAGVSWRGGDVTGCPIIEGALAFMECHVVEVHSGGDHDIFLGRVASVAVRDGAPLVYWRGSYSTLPPPPEAEAVDGRSMERLAPLGSARRVAPKHLGVPEADH
jgi:flavin reductase (DIM6/NTAB) family NADH-FMN oxidoreductase RutF